MTATVFQSPTEIATESLRYSTDMPGQALGYMMGALRILELRERAEAALGEAFDLRAFHEAVVGPGSLPMSTLEGHIDWWIEQQQAAESSSIGPS